jgi:hypothetical protein
MALEVSHKRFFACKRGKITVTMGRFSAFSSEASKVGERPKTPAMGAGFLTHP